MEETLQQEKQGSEYQNPNEEQGGIRRRLRDRDLLRKRKAEAEEKETNQEESPRKRPRAEYRGGSKKRGRPRKTESTPEISVSQEEAQGDPAVLVVSEPAEVIPDQTSGSLSFSPTVESQPASVPTTPALLPVFGSVQRSVFAATLTPPASDDPTPALFSPSIPAPAPAKGLDTIQFPVLDLAPAPDAVPLPDVTQTPVPAAAPAPPADLCQVGALPLETEAFSRVVIEDLGPDEEEDNCLSLSQEDKRADEDLSETTPINVPEQNKMFSVPTLSSPPPPQEYLPGN